MNPVPDAPSEPSILLPGRNAWRIARADALAFLIDGEEYFAALDKTLRTARRSIRIVGWDFNPDIRLRPREGGETLGVFLRQLVERAPELEIHILVWAMGPIYSSHSLKVFRRDGWSSHPRIHLCFDTRHALRGSHHQKIVTVDDAIAFVGGIDLTGARWDTGRHAAHCPERTRPNGEPYGPVHDVQAMFCGAAARAAADLARWRWELAAGTKAAPVRDARAAWPQEIRADMRGCATAIARSVPALSGLDERRETFRLTRDALAAAKRHIYIETQYLASFDIGDVLEERLAERHGPEIAILVTSSSRGLLEQFVMAHNRDRLIRRLHDADRFGRLRAMYAVVPAADGSECEVLIHSKVLIVDDAFVRIGSSNMNNRSEAMDMECDIAVEAACADERRAIAALRERLMAEHLDTSPAAVAAAMRRGGSLTGAIDRLNRRPRGLRPFSVDPVGGTAPVPGTTLLDPKRPFSPLRRAREVIASAVSRLMPGAL